MNILTFIAAIIFFFPSGLVSQSAGSADTSTVKADSVRWIMPIPDIGTIEPFKQFPNSITSNSITRMDYRSLYDLLARQPGIFVRDLAGAGQAHQLVINGIDDRAVAIMIDGIPMNDYYTGSYNEWRIPVESIDRVELITGADALFYDGVTGGGAINIVTKNFDNNRAITKLRYSQGVSGYSQTDALFAQNIMSSVNLSMALSHYGFGSNKESQSYRARFYNSNHDSWTFRSKLRYKIAPSLDVTFSYLYDRGWTGLNGGVNYRNTTAVYDGLIASVHNMEAYEKQFNSHYNLSAAYFPFEDSSFLATVSLYSFDRLREYRDEENRSLPRNSIYSIVDFPSRGNGAKAQILSHFSEFRLLGYTDIKHVQSNDIITLGIKTEIFPQSFVTITPFAAVTDRKNQFIAHGGVEGTVRFTSSLSVYGSIAQNLVDERSGTAAVNASVFSMAQRFRETYSILEAGMRYTVGSVLTGGISLQRTIQKHPVIFDTIAIADPQAFQHYYFPDEHLTDAVSAYVHSRWGDIHFNGSGTVLNQPSINRAGTAITRYPELTLNGSVYFQGFVANGALDLTIGFKGAYYSEQTGMTPYDQFGIWIPSTQLRYGPGGAVDFFAVGKIGDAYIHFMWENLTGSQYLLAPVYPLYERNIRFGVAWEFLD